MKTMKIQLWDSFNGSRISTHRTLENAVLAQRRHLARVQKHNGTGSYLTYEYRTPDGVQVDPDGIIPPGGYDIDTTRFTVTAK